MKAVLAAKGFAGHHKGWFTRTAETKARAIQTLFAARILQGKDIINVAMRRVLKDLARDILDLPDPTTWANIETCLALAVFFATPLHEDEPEAEHETRATLPQRSCRLKLTPPLQAAAAKNP